MHRTWLVTFILKRLLYAVPLVVAVVVVNFILIKAAPGDPVTVLIGDYPATQDYIDQIRAQYGLDQPLHVQLWLYLSEVAKGNLGESLSQHQPVAALLLDRLGQTVKLTLTALAIATVAGVALGPIRMRSRPCRMPIRVFNLHRIRTRRCSQCSHRNSLRTRSNSPVRRSLPRPASNRRLNSCHLVSRSIRSSPLHRCSRHLRDHLCRMHPQTRCRRHSFQASIPRRRRRRTR